MNIESIERFSFSTNFNTIFIPFSRLLFSPCSCVAENSLGRAKKYIEVSGRPGPAQFHSPMYSRYREMYNLTWSIESFPLIEEIRLLYRKLMVSNSTGRRERIGRIAPTPCVVVTVGSFSYHLFVEEWSHRTVSAVAKES